VCTFCVKHGEGKRWYLTARNYAADLESDLKRRGFMVGFVQGFERSRRSTTVGGIPMARNVLFFKTGPGYRQMR
jgi:hypothetical protein